MLEYMTQHTEQGCSDDPKVTLSVLGITDYEVTDFEGACLLGCGGGGGRGGG